MAAASATRICRCASSQGRRSSARHRGRGRRCTHSSRSRSVSQPVSTTLLSWSTLHGPHYTRKVALNGVHFVGGVPGGDATGLVYQYYHQPQLLGLTPAGGTCTRTHAAAAAAARASEAEPNPHLQLHPHPPRPTPPCCCRAPLASPLHPCPSAYQVPQSARASKVCRSPCGPSQCMAAASTDSGPTDRTCRHVLTYHCLLTLLLATYSNPRAPAGMHARRAYAQAHAWAYR